MQYIFNEGVDLCGWQKLPYALRDRRGGKKAKIIWANKHFFDMLSLCDGNTDFDMVFFSDEDRKLLKELEKNGIIKECKSDSEKKEVSYTYYDNRYIETIHWSITGKCNAKCRHCYMSAPDAKYGELSHETIFKIIDEMKDAGVASVTLTGGECLVRSDFLSIVDKLIESNIHISVIYTNGFLVNDKLLTELSNRNIHPEFNMSFDGVGNHDWMRGIKGAEEMTSNALRLCKKYGFPTGVEMCLFRKNLHTLRETINYLASLGVRGIKCVPVSESEFWKKYGDNDPLSLNEVYDTYLEYIPHFYEDKMPMEVMLGGFFMGLKGKEDYFIPSYKFLCNMENTCACNHARLIMYISAEGRALPCMSLSACDAQLPFPLVQDIGLKKCLTDSYYMNFISTTVAEIINHNEDCKVCEFKERCYGGCRASALAFGEDLLGPDRAVCKIFKDGYIEKIQEAVKKACSTAKQIK